MAEKNYYKLLVFSYRCFDGEKITNKGNMELLNDILYLWNSENIFINIEIEEGICLLELFGTNRREIELLSDKLKNLAEFDSHDEKSDIKDLDIFQNMKQNELRDIFGCKTDDIFTQNNSKIYKDISNIINYYYCPSYVLNLMIDEPITIDFRKIYDTSNGRLQDYKDNLKNRILQNSVFSFTKNKRKKSKKRSKRKN